MAYHYLYYGPDTYSSTEAIRKLTNKYIDSSLGDTNLAKIDSEKTTVEDIIRQIYTAPFLANKRLVILENFLLSKDEKSRQKIKDILEKTPSTTILVFWEKGIPDAKSELFQALNVKKTAQKFELMTPIKLSAWIDKFCINYHASILPSARQLLIARIGPDLYRMSNECSKLIAFSNGKPISEKMVDELVDQTEDAQSFALIDQLFGKLNPAKAISIYHTIEAGGEYPLVVLSLISNTLTRVMIIKSWLGKGLSINDINSKLKMHPYALRKTVDNYLSVDDDICTYRRELILTVDEGIKSGKIEAQNAINYLIAKWK